MSATDARRPSAAIDALGWAGMVAVTAAFGLNAAKVLDDGAFYQALNAFGALALFVVCLRKRDWPTMTLEIVWLGVSLWRLGALWLLT
ncbi:MAG: hypothetical protein H6832_15155 [Planctomycetes bacterium]|nr:hypothetical protein [Planctomycetota bacterium]